MMRLNFPGDLASIACVGAHADDIEIGAGGMVAAIARELPSARFTFIVLSADAVRRDEAIQSARDLLGDRVALRFGDFEDAYLPYRDPAGVKDLLRSEMPADADLVLGPNRFDEHQDHRFVSQLIDEVCRNHLVLSYEIAKTDGDLRDPNVYFALSTRDAQSKADHLMAQFESQRGGSWYSRDAFLSIMRLRGIEARATDGYAEAFHSSAVVVSLES